MSILIGFLQSQFIENPEFLKLSKVVVKMQYKTNIVKNDAKLAASEAIKMYSNNISMNRISMMQEKNMRN